MSIGILAASVAMLAVSGIADKGPDFHRYRAPLPAFSGGDGGEYTTADGIEVWSNGAPARPFQILGTLADTRGIGSYAGPTRSGFIKLITRETKAAGGDAAILEIATPDPDPDRVSSDVTSRAMRNFLSGSAPLEDVPWGYNTRFWVVKYLTGPTAGTGP